jgi:DNA-directed RNA polymerase specialized sigma24 family protein
MSDARGDVGERAQDPRDGRLISWFQRWRRPIRYWLSSRSSVPAAEIDDLAQEVFLRLLRYSDDIAIDNPQSYLFRIASNVANEWRERAVRRQPHDNSWLEDLQRRPGAEPEKRGRLRRAARARASSCTETSAASALSAAAARQRRDSPTNRLRTDWGSARASCCAISQSVQPFADAV